MVKFSFLLKIAMSFSVGGAVLGTVEGLIFSVLYISVYYGNLGVIFHLLAGLILGLTNGLILGTLRFRLFEKPIKQINRMLLMTSIILTFITSIFVYGLIYFPLARTLEGDFNLGGTIVFSLLPTVIATLIAAYASQRISISVQT